MNGSQDFAGIPRKFVEVKVWEAMTSACKKPAAVAYPKTLLSIVVSLGGLAIFSTLTSSLISQRFGSRVRDYIYVADHLTEINVIGTAPDETVVNFSHPTDISGNILGRSKGAGNYFQESDGGFGDSRIAESISQHNKFTTLGQSNGKGNALVKNLQPSASGDKNELVDSRQQQKVAKDLAEPPAGFGSSDAMAQQMHFHIAQQEKGINNSSFSTGGDAVQIASSLSSNVSNSSNMQVDAKNETQLPSPDSSIKDVVHSPPIFTDTSQGSSVDSGATFILFFLLYSISVDFFSNTTFSPF